MDRGYISEAARLVAERISEGSDGIETLAFPTGNVLGPEVARQALEAGYEDRGFIFAMRQKVQGPFVQEVSYGDTRETGKDGKRLEPKLRLVCVPADDVPDAPDSVLRISDEARMADRAIKSGIARYERNSSRDTMSPLALVSSRKSRLFALARNDAGITRVGELKRPDVWSAPRIVSPLQYLAAGIMKNAFAKEGGEPDYVPFIERAQAIEAAIGSGSAALGFTVVDEESLREKTAEWRRGGLRPVRFTEDERAGSTAFNNDVLFGQWDPRPCDTESRLRVERQMAPFPGFYAMKKIPLAKPTGEALKEPARYSGDWQSIH